MRVWSIIFLSILTLCACTGELAPIPAPTEFSKAAPSSTQQNNVNTITGTNQATSSWQPWQWQAVNDTAVDQCFYHLNMTTGIPCSSTPAHSFDPKQDGMVGLDATNNAAFDGSMGFSFINVATSFVIPLHASFPCVYDNTTGLTWQRKGYGYSDWHDEHILFTNYTESSKHQVLDLTNNTSRPPTVTEIDKPSNIMRLIKDVNVHGFCSYQDWRLPTVAELFSLYDFGKRLYPNSPISNIYNAAIDSQWFINLSQPINGYGYWTSTDAYYPGGPISEKETHAMVVSFNNRSNPVFSHARSDKQRVILVRGNPY